MPDLSLMHDREFGPDEISQMQEAYEKAISRLELTDRSHFLRALMAKQIMEAAATGETDPAVMAERALEVAAKHERYVGRRSEHATET